MLQSAGLVNINIEEQADVAALSSHVLSLSYEFAGYGEVLILNNAVSFCDDLVMTAEMLGNWRRSTLIRSTGPEYTQESERSSSSLVLARQRELLRFERALKVVARAALQVYTMRNTFVQTTGLTEFELLRYGKNEEFRCHVDHVAGQQPMRMISMLAYLNEDFEGGVIEFPRQGIAYRPRKGAVLLFPSNFVYPHASTPVTSGTKYAVVGWFLG